MLEHPNSYIDYQGETYVDETMDNQQKLLETDKAYLAAMIEGEGSICLNVRKKKWKGWSGVGVDLSVSVINIDAGIIKKCVDICKKMGVEPHIFESQTSKLYRKDGKEYHNPQKTILYMNISSMNKILTVLTNIYPYMAGDKKHRAELMMEFVTRRINYKGPKSNQFKNTNGQSWYTGYDWNLVKKFYDISGGKLLPEVQQFLNDHQVSVQ